ncbi:HD-GYP domain-containing protein [Heliorestis acidaminivorans]|uniref:HD-GYP domain-containing protein n=1 Tax=Heliorestis acidaminivorans TaxID=553427 RepID=A0A6I0EVD0_9FIRM|nr:HD-GYP domain-containing protein [Heliorestis acidaminivorans]KAB2951839.1 HD-GYP domain-containing protein [Heliorestis acidaminivorans]
MSRQIHVTLINNDVRLAKPVYSKTGAVLLPIGKTINNRYVSYLKNQGIEFIDIEVGTTESPTSLSKENTVQNNEQEQGQDKEAYKDKARDIFKDAVTNSSDFNFLYMLKRDLSLSVQESVCNFARQDNQDVATVNVIIRIFDDILQNPGDIINLLALKSTDGFTYKHSINVAVLSLLMAMNLGYREEEQKVIAKGAFFHDIGKHKIPREILFNDGVLDAESRRKIEEHPRKGYEILEGSTHMTEEAAKIALQHHERLNGTGYPQGLKGKDITLASQIVGIADVFEAMISNRKHRSSYNPVEIIEYLMTLAGTHFQEQVVKALLNSITIYQIGSLVELSNGERAVVVEVNFSVPTRPVVRVVFDSRDLPVRQKREIDLSAKENMTLNIQRSFG